MSNIEVVFTKDPALAGHPLWQISAHRSGFAIGNTSGTKTSGRALRTVCAGVPYPVKGGGRYYVGKVCKPLYHMRRSGKGTGVVQIIDPLGGIATRRIIEQTAI